MKSTHTRQSSQLKGYAAYLISKYEKYPGVFLILLKVQFAFLAVATALVIDRPLYFSYAILDVSCLQYFEPLTVFSVSSFKHGQFGVQLLELSDTFASYEANVHHMHHSRSRGRKCGELRINDDVPWYV